MSSYMYIHVHVKPAGIFGRMQYCSLWQNKTDTHRHTDTHTHIWDNYHNSHYHACTRMLLTCTYICTCSNSSIVKYCTNLTKNAELSAWHHRTISASVFLSYQHKTNTHTYTYVHVHMQHVYVAYCYLIYMYMYMYIYMYMHIHVNVHASWYMNNHLRVRTCT